MIVYISLSSFKGVRFWSIDYGNIVNKIYFKEYETKGVSFSFPYAIFISAKEKLKLNQIQKILVFFLIFAN